MLSSWIKSRKSESDRITYNIYIYGYGYTRILLNSRSSPWMSKTSVTFTYFCKNDKEEDSWDEIWEMKPWSDMIRDEGEIGNYKNKICTHTHKIRCVIWLQSVFVTNVFFNLLLKIILSKIGLVRIWNVWIQILHNNT